MTYSPREVFERLIDGISHGRWHRLADLYAEDVTVEQPLAPPAADRPAAARSRLQGREQVAAHFAAAAGMPLELQARNVVVHQTTDPEVIVAEFDYYGRNSTTGRTFRAANVQVLRVRDGLIVSSRDYHDHLALANALGALPALVSAFTTRQPEGVRRTGSGG